MPPSGNVTVGGSSSSSGETVPKPSWIGKDVHLFFSVPKPPPKDGNSSTSSSSKTTAASGAAQPEPEPTKLSQLRSDPPSGPPKKHLGMRKSPEEAGAEGVPPKVKARLHKMQGIDVVMVVNIDETESVLLVEPSGYTAWLTTLESQGKPLSWRERSLGREVPSSKIGSSLMNLSRRSLTSGSRRKSTFECPR